MKILAVHLLLAAALLKAQDQGIYGRVRKALGEAAEQELRSGHFAQVEERLRAAKPATEADQAELLSVSGAVEFLDGNVTQAAADFRHAQMMRPLREADQFTLAMALVRLGDEKESRVVLTKLVEDHSSTAIYWYWLGRLDYYQRRYGEAVDKLQRAVQLDPKSTRGWDSLGLAWDMQGRLEEARAKFEKAVALNREQPRKSPWPPHDLGYLLLRMGETTHAEALLRESLRYDDNLAQTHYYLARSLEKEGRSDESIREYQIAVKDDPSATDSCYSLAMLFRKLHREVEAKAMFEEYRKRKASASSQADTGQISHER